MISQVLGLYYKIKNRLVANHLLSNVSSIQTIYTVRSDNTTLLVILSCNNSFDCMTVNFFCNDSESFGKNTRFRNISWEHELLYKLHHRIGILMTLNMKIKMPVLHLFF